MTDPRRRRRLIWTLVVLHVLALTCGLAVVVRYVVRPTHTTATYLSAPRATPFSVTRPTPQHRTTEAIGDVVTPTRRSPHSCPVRLRPQHLVVPNLCIDTSVVPTGRTPRGALVIPPSTQQVGQWNAGAPTTETSTGTTLIAGHVTLGAQGKGALFLLSTVHAGDRVYLTGTTGTVTRWTIVALSEVQKTRLPDSVFAGRQGPRQLVVVTCGGPIIDLPGYGPWHRDNVIATATPS